MEKEKSIKIEKLVIDVEGEKISLSIEKAKKLFEALGDLFEKEVVKEYHYHNRWYWDWYNRPHVYYGFTTNLQGGLSGGNANHQFVTGNGTIFQASNAVLTCQAK